MSSQRSGKRGASRVTPIIRFGPAGFLYKDWEGIVYPQPKPPKFDQLKYISELFDTVEINSSFYGPPLPRTTASWVKRVKDNKDFRFTAKLWKRFTHERNQAWTTEEVDQVKQGFDTMMDSGRLGAVLLQFPWSFKRSEQTREWLGDVTRTFSEYPLVIEVRHTSWLTHDFFQQLEEDGIGFVNIDQPMYRDSIGPSAHVTSHVGYVRVHGRNYREWFRDKAGVEQRYNYLYSAAELKPWVERTEEIAADPATKEVFVITNNHYKGKAVANALMMKSMVTRQKVPAPSGVFGTYHDAVAEYTKPVEPKSLSNRLSSLTASS